MAHSALRALALQKPRATAPRTHTRQTELCSAMARRTDDSGPPGTQAKYPDKAPRTPSLAQKTSYASHSEVATAQIPQPTKATRQLPKRETLGSGTKRLWQRQDKRSVVVLPLSP